MRFYCFQYSLFHIHICILSQRSPDFHVFSVILVLRKNAVPADASAAAITLPPQPAWRGGLSSAVVNGVACPLLWRVWCHGASGAVARLVLWCICAATHLAQRRAWHSGAFGTAARLAQRRTWHSGTLGAVVRMEKLGNSHQLPQIGPPFVYLGLSYTALNLFHAGFAR